MKTTSRILMAGLLTACLVTSSCFKATFVRPTAPSSAKQEEWYTFWLFGIVGEKRINVSRYCPSGNIRMVRTGGNVGTSLVTLLTLGIYAPRKIYIQCGRDGRTELESPSGNRVEANTGLGTEPGRRFSDSVESGPNETARSAQSPGEVGRD